jgi:CBS domain-containing protein
LVSSRPREPVVVSTTASKRFRHLPVMGDAGLAGIVDITDVCRALLAAGVSGPPAGTAQAE